MQHTDEFVAVANTLASGKLPENFSLDMKLWFDRDEPTQFHVECGYAGCAIGLHRYLYPESEMYMADRYLPVLKVGGKAVELVEYHAVAKYFGLTFGETLWAFSAMSYPGYEDDSGISPAEVAERMFGLLHQHGVQR